MKIGILTFHRAVNYGAVLQAFALCKFIKELGVDCELIDYRCMPVEAIYEPYFLFRKEKSIKSFFKEFVKAPFKMVKKRQFEKFLKRLTLSEKQYTKENIILTNDIYDLFICGSDQIWNLTITGGDDTFYLPFVDDVKKRISYAASLGFEAFPEKDLDKYFELINGIGTISVREKEAAMLIQQVCGKESVVCVDPTLLINADAWEEVVEHKVKEKFIFVYAVNKPIKLLEYAKKIAERKGCKIIYLSDYWGYDKNVKYVKTMSPEKFLEHIKCAEYVVTNSFHGTVFSIIFKRKFAVELENKTKFNYRAEFLLKQLGLENHVIKSVEQIIDVDEDWLLIDERLNLLQKKSKEYLMQVIQKIDIKL